MLALSRLVFFSLLALGLVGQALVACVRVFHVYLV